MQTTVCNLKILTFAIFSTCGQLRHKHIVQHIKRLKECFMMALLDLKKTYSVDFFLI